MKSAETPDFLIIGGGIIGITIANELVKRYQDAKVVVIEKERDSGFHASGRNSGVLHAGFYYFPDSLKAKLTRLGNTILTKYCEERNLKINKCGKLVVAKNENELQSLNVLLERGKANGVDLREVTEKEAKEIEPRIKTIERAIYSPSTSSVDPQQIVQSLKQDAIDAGVEFRFDESFIDKQGKKTVVTNKGYYEAGYIINAAGLYADKIALKFGYARDHKILPFKGLYLYSSEAPGSVKCHVYPVPDLNNPFLGVHYTVTVEGKIKIGPTAIPALWREQYEGFANFSFTEFSEILFRQMGLMFSSHFDFKNLAAEEARKYSKTYMAIQAAGMLENVNPHDYKKWGRPGIRAQLFETKKRKLEMDFVLEGDDTSMHVLNAVSPAFTCSIPFAEYVCDKIDNEIN